MVERIDHLHARVSRPSQPTIVDTSTNDPPPQSLAAKLGRRPAAAAPTGDTIIVLEERKFLRDMLTCCFEDAMAATVRPVASAAACLREVSEVRSAIIVVCISGENDHEAADAHLAQLAEAGCTVPVVVFGDQEDSAHVIRALQRGAKGYIPTSLSLSAAVHAMRFVAAGGLFIPASTLLINGERPEDTPSSAALSMNGIFTPRQLAVIDALIRGKSNKIIAYDLNMRESTVKVHVRNIMKKLNAKNRTEVAYRAHELISGHLS